MSDSHSKSWADRYIDSLEWQMSAPIKGASTLTERMAFDREMTSRTVDGLRENAHNWRERCLQSERRNDSLRTALWCCAVVIALPVGAALSWLISFVRFP